MNPNKPNNITLNSLCNKVVCYHILPNGKLLEYLIKNPFSLEEIYKNFISTREYLLLNQELYRNEPTITTKIKM